MILFSDTKAELIPVPKRAPRHEGAHLHAFLTSALVSGHIPTPAALAGKQSGCLLDSGVGGPRDGAECGEEHKTDDVRTT